MARSPFSVPRRAWMLAVCVVLMVALAMVARAEEDPGAPMEGIVAMDESSFAELVGKERGALVEFYAPWCGHCKTMAPELRALGQLYMKTPSAQKTVVIGKVDATAHRDLATAHGVTGFPTILYFPPQSTTPQKYDDQRTVEGMVKFLNRKIPQVGLFVPKEPQFATEVTSADFDAVVLDPTKDAIVLMYAPWCGHCKRFKPIYNKLAKIFENEEDVVVAMIDADASENKALGAKYKITGYPTVLFFGKNNKAEPEEYVGERELEEIVVFMNEHTGKKRLLDGDLAWSYGVEETLSKAIANIVKAAEDKRAALAKDAQAAIAKMNNAIGAEYYAKVAERVATVPDYLSGEKARLERLLEGTVGGKKRDNLILRFNILASIEEQL